MLRYIVLISCSLLVAQGHATTVYKSIDANGVVSYTDAPPAQGGYEVVDVSAPPPSSSLAEAQARQSQMQTVTDNIASARKAREQARYQARAKTRSVAANYLPYPSVDSTPAEPIYYGYPYYRGRGHFQRPPPSNRPVDQIDPPPMRRRLPTVPVIPR
ncbi:MAG: DUF4124 domain-containing protein [Pseudomonadales bacterium]